jgi:hypothetical protein
VAKYNIYLRVADPEAIEDGSVKEEDAYELLKADATLSELQLALDLSTRYQLDNRKTKGFIPNPVTWRVV